MSTILFAIKLYIGYVLGSLFVGLITIFLVITILAYLGGK